MTACRHKHSSWAKSIFPVQLVHCKGGDASLETEAKRYLEYLLMRTAA